MVSIEALLGLIGLFVTVIGTLVYIIYVTLVKSIETERRAREDSAKDIWKSINELKENHHETDKSHATLCQKHEDIMKELNETLKRQDIAIHDRQTVFESRIKGMVEFTSQRNNERNKRR